MQVISMGNSPKKQNPLPEPPESLQKYYRRFKTCDQINCDSCILDCMNNTNWVCTTDAIDDYGNYIDALIEYFGWRK